MVQTMTLKELRPELPRVVERIDKKLDRYVITRHGKPAAAMVPIQEVQQVGPETPTVRRRSSAEVERFLDSFGTASARDSAVAQLRRDRR